MFVWVLLFQATSSALLGRIPLPGAAAAFSAASLASAPGDMKKGPAAALTLKREFHARRVAGLRLAAPYGYSLLPLCATSKPSPLHPQPIRPERRNAIAAPTGGKQTWEHGISILSESWTNAKRLVNSKWGCRLIMDGCRLVPAGWRGGRCDRTTSVSLAVASASVNCDAASQSSSAGPPGFLSVDHQGAAHPDMLPGVYLEVTPPLDEELVAGVETTKGDSEGQEPEECAPSHPSSPCPSSSLEPRTSSRSCHPDSRGGVGSAGPGYFRVRQVPGDGSCLFHAIAASLHHRKHGSHPSFDEAMHAESQRLRQLAVDTLSTEGLPLFLEGGEWSTSGDILDLMKTHMNRSREEYCEWMRRPGSWGGGPEIVALSNRLRVPIHVYEVCALPAASLEAQPTGSSSSRAPVPPLASAQIGGALGGLRLLPAASTSWFALRLSCRFGSPLFDSDGASGDGSAEDRAEAAVQEPIRILSADGRFPHILPGQQKQPGDHFFALFPCPPP